MIIQHSYIIECRGAATKRPNRLADAASAIVAKKAKKEEPKD